MSRRSSYCHLCNITSTSGEPTEYVMGRPVYGTVTQEKVSCRFYKLSGPMEEAADGPRVIEITKLRVPLNTSITTDATVTGLSSGFERTYKVDALPEIIYGNKHPVCIECTLKSVDGGST